DSSSYEPREAFVSEDGEKLLFRSQNQLTPYDNEGVPELYLYSAADESIACVSCRPSGEMVKAGPRLATVSSFPQLSPIDEISAVASRNLSASGGRAFFESEEALSPEDTNGVTDVYEWETPGGEGSCEVGSASYSLLNEGCLYLISIGKSKYPS